MLGFFQGFGIIFSILNQQAQDIHAMTGWSYIWCVRKAVKIFFDTKPPLDLTAEKKVH